jgi:hypothetical protein
MKSTIYKIHLTLVIFVPEIWLFKCSNKDILREHLIYTYMHGKAEKQYNCIFEIFLRPIWNDWPPFKLLIKLVLIGNPKFTTPLTFIYIYIICQLKDLILTLFGLIFRRIYIFRINLVSQVNLRSSGTDNILYGCHLLRCLYNILCFLWLHDEIFIILYNILKIAELDCCQNIILSIYVPSTHA